MTGTFLPVRASTLLTALRAVEHAAVNGGPHPILSSVVLSVDDDGARLVAADNHRLAIVDLDVEDGEGDLRGEFPIDLAYVKPLVAFLKLKKHGPVAFKFDEAAPLTLTIIAADGTMIVRLLDGAYPDWRAIDTPHSPALVALDLAILADLAKLARADRGKGIVRLHVEGPLQPVLFKGSGVREIVMPVRMVDAPPIRPEHVLAAVGGRWACECGASGGGVSRLVSHVNATLVARRLVRQGDAPEAKAS